MSTGSQIQPGANRPDVAAGIVKRFVQIAFFSILQAGILFLGAGRIDWIWAWVYLAMGLVSVAINSAFLLRTSPETIAERGQPGATKGWDRIVGGAYGLVQFLLIPLVAAVDERFGWTGTLTTAWHIAGGVVLALGLALGGWAMIINPFFSTAVRIQSERGQTVCRRGPYRCVRHPGYAGFILQSLGTPLLLGSLWALIPAFTAAALLVVRTIGEDRMLQAELPGYLDYVQEVHDRLAPGIW